MAKLRHLALWTRQPEKMAEFYTRVFEMKETFRTKNGSIHLSDGEVNCAGTLVGQSHCHLFESPFILRLRGAFPIEAVSGRPAGEPCMCAS